MGRSRALFTLLLSALGAGGSACGSGAPDVDVTAATAPPPAAAPAPAAPAVTASAWGACPSGFTSECATFSVPLEHATPDGEKIDLFVARSPAVTPGGPALWLLQGGPGGSGADLVDVIGLLAKANPSFDIYTLDHRGVGHSTPLECAAQEAALGDDDSAATGAAWDACIMHLQSTRRLRGFDVTEAAHDLSDAIRATRKEGQEVVVYGVSYGTYWLNRYLQLHPEEPTAAIMDSTVVPELMIGPEADQQADPIAKQYFDACGRDTFCASKLGTDPWATLGRVFDGLRQGRCSTLGLTPKLLRGTLGALFDDRDARVLLLAMVHRIDRCTAADVTAVVRFYDRIFQKPFYNGYSAELQYHVLLSEFWPPTTASVAELRDAAERVYIGGDYGPLGAKLYPKWPRYQPDALAHRWHASPRPVLLLAGTLDVRTPYATMTSTVGHGTLVTFPGEGHGSLVQSRVKDPAKPPCGLTIVSAFAASGGRVIDTTCLADLAPQTFTFGADVAGAFFGTVDLWD